MFTYKSIWLCNLKYLAKVFVSYEPFHILSQYKHKQTRRVTDEAVEKV